MSTLTLIGLGQDPDAGTLTVVAPLVMARSRPSKDSIRLPAPFVAARRMDRVSMNVAVSTSIE